MRALGILAVGLLLSVLPAAGDNITSKVVIEGTYEDVRYDLEDAIVSRGLTVDHISHVSDMLQRTADVVPGSTQIYNQGEQFRFCSATLSPAAMQADPANITFCPYMVFIYEAADKPGMIHLGFRRLNEIGSEQSIKALAAVNALLKEIVSEVSGN